MKVLCRRALFDNENNILIRIVKYLDKNGKVQVKQTTYKKKYRGCYIQQGRPTFA